MQMELTMGPPMARRTDPATSHRAAESVAVSAEAQRQRIYWSLIRFGGALNADEIAQREGMTMEQVCRRLPELVRDGRLERLDETRPTRTGRAAHLYRLRPTGGC